MDASAQRSVLVVEDNEDLRNLCIYLLEVEGYQAIGAEDGLQALRFLESEPQVACVIVLDLQMPRLDGLALLKRKARNPELAGIPVIVVSATTEAAGALPTPDVKAVLPKPTAVPELLREVNRWAMHSECSAGRRLLQTT
jgi:CheY-like chemotaxis protein